MRDDFASWLDEFRAWAALGVDRFVTAIRAARGRADVPNWTRQNTTPDFWARRMCHETAIHRWDLENTTDAASPLLAHIAADALDELIEVVLPHWMMPRRPDAVVPPARLRATDVAYEVAIEPNGTTADATLELTGTASELVLVLLGRVEPSSANHDASAPQCLATPLQVFGHLISGAGVPLMAGRRTARQSPG